MSSAKVPSSLSHASWIWVSNEPFDRFHRAFFTKSLSFPEARSLRIHVSADALYELWINGEILSRGPLRGDLEHYPFDTLEVNMPSEGKLLLTAAVVAPSRHIATGEFFFRPGFLLAAEALDGDGRVVGETISDESWMAVMDPAFDRNDCDDRNWDRTPMGAVGYGERLDFRKWKDAPRLGANAGLDWHSACVTAGAQEKDKTGKHLVPREVSPPELRKRELGICFQPGRGDTATPIEIGPQGGTVFLDHETLTTGYPTLIFMGGAGRKVRIIYAEVLNRGSDKEWVRSDNGLKGAWETRVHRRCESTKTCDVPPMRYYDEMILAEGEISYTPGYLRTYRFLKIEIEPGDGTAVFKGGSHVESTYPLPRRWRFECSNPEFSQVAEVAFRTQRLCAHDHFEDCPYYERLQYAGDTVLQAIMAYQTTGELLLGRQALRQFAWSRAPEKPTLVCSRYPSHIPQAIETFTAFWLQMAEEWLRFSEDEQPVREVADRMIEIVEFVAHHHENGFYPIGTSFIDWAWCSGLDGLKLPSSDKGESSIVNLQWAWSLDSLARSLDLIGRPDDAGRAREVADTLRGAVLQECVPDEGPVLDVPGQRDLSQHAQVWAILTDLVPEDRQHRLLDATLTDDRLVPLTPYHRYFLFRAAEKLGRYEEVFPQIRQWVDMVDKGFSTFPEEDGRHGFIRSECHAWTAWPLTEFLEQILGVKILGPRRIRLAPRSCGLGWARGTVPLPEDPPGRMENIRVEWRVENGRMHVSATAPANLEVETPEGFELHLTRA